MTESERRNIREPVILGHPSPHPLIFLPLLSPDLLDSLCLYFIPVPHGHNSLVSADADHHGFKRQRTATRPKGKGQCFISQLSCDVSLATVWMEERTRLDFLCFSATESHRHIGKAVGFGLSVLT